jgi:hypothetical protein
MITLNATASSDPDGQIVSYRWQQMFGTKTGTEYMTSNRIVFSDSTLPILTFSPQWPGNYCFKLRVTDDHNRTNEDMVNVGVCWDRNPLEMQGINSWGYYQDSTSLNSYVSTMVEDLRSKSNAEWIEIAPIWWMENRYSNNVHPLGDFDWNAPGYTIRDTNVVQLIGICHSKGWKVFLRPTIELYHWAEPRIFLEPTDWDLWFGSYKNFITHYARLAERTNVELFAVGNELWGSEKHTQKWRDVISAVRNIYNGHLTYSSMANEYLNQYRPVPEFWPDLDYIGIDDYVCITGEKYDWDSGVEPMNDPPFEIFVRTLEKHIEEIFLPLYQKYNKPILITECGMPNYDGANLDPGYYLDISTKPIDNQEQADYYEAMMQVISKKDWIKGIFMFEHSLQLDFNFQLTDTPISFDFKHKPAEGVLKFWYK